jgi:phosphoribosyl 1,2-cyclic phosphodiesterase
MNIICHASGSTGNLYTIQDCQTKLMIEAGLPIKEINRLTNYSISSYDACLITHRHLDHCKGAEDLERYGIEVQYGSEFKQNGNPVLFGGNNPFEVKAFPVPHTVPCFGFIIRHAKSGETCVFMTDLSYCPAPFSFSPTIIMAECNYADDLIPSDCAREDSIFGAHMSLDTCIKTLQANDLTKTREIWLLHLSSSHSDEARFVREVQEAIGVPTYAAPAYSRKEILLAKYPSGTDGVCGSCKGKDEDCALCETTGKVTLVL